MMEGQPLLVMPPGLIALALAILVALLIDGVWGEPPARWHPVVWMGRYLGRAGAWAAPVAPASPAVARRAWWRGTMAWWAGAATVGVGAAVLQALLASLPSVWQGLLLGLCLKPMLAWRMLRDEVAAVEAALGRSLRAGREQVQRLVSRDVQALDEPDVRGAALSTLAENLNDSVVAPLLWFAIVGLPGAVLYRYANTADAMWGYQGPRGGRDWTWAGRWAARTDDALSWLPARLTAGLLWVTRPRCASAPTAGRTWCWRQLRTQARRTPSPNGGWPMATLALGLGGCLRKPGVYVLNEAGRAPQPADTECALHWCQTVVSVLAVGALVALLAGLSTEAWR
jgi:adenosylcobinamide-phosphate synthase